MQTPTLFVFDEQSNFDKLSLEILILGSFASVDESKISKVSFPLIFPWKKKRKDNFLGLAFNSTSLEWINNIWLNIAVWLIKCCF